MRWLLIIIFIVLLTTAVSADVDTVRENTHGDVTSVLWDAYLEPFEPSLQTPDGAFANILDNGGGEISSIVIGVSGLDALIGTNTRDSVLFRIARHQSGDPGDIVLRGLWKWKFNENDPTYADWDEPNLEWSISGALDSAAIANGTFNTTDGGGDDATTEFLDTVSAWNGSQAYFTGSDRLVDSTFWRITTGDTVWWQIWPPTGTGADAYIALSEHGTVPLEIIIYSTPSACIVTHSLQATDTTLTTIEIENDYTYDGDSTLKAVEMIWDDDDNPADPLGRDSVSIGHPAVAPDTLTATGLNASTQYWFWWIINHGTCDPDTSDALTLFTKSSPPDIKARYRGVTLRKGKF